MSPLLELLTLLGLSGCCMVCATPTVVSAVPGSSVTLRCHYSPELYRQAGKVWCWHTSHSTCQRLADTSKPHGTSYWQPAVQSRTRIRDDPVSGVVTVTMEGLQAQNSGQYHCRVTVPTGVVIIRTIQLNVLEDPALVLVDVGGFCSMQCPYSAVDYQLVPRAWCRLSPGIGCQPLRGSLSSHVYRGPRRSRISEDTVRGVTTLSMEGLQLEDSGVYECQLLLPRSPLVMKRFQLQIPGWIMEQSRLFSTLHSVPQTLTPLPRTAQQRRGDLQEACRHPRHAVGPALGVSWEPEKIVPCDMRDEDATDFIKYTTLRLGSISEPPEATYVNVRYQPRTPEAPDSPPILTISGPVEYATVFFRPSGLTTPVAH